MTLSLVYLPFLILAPAVEAFLIQMLPRETVIKQRQGEELCEANGLTLPILPTLDDWDDFVSGVKVIAESQGENQFTYQPWLAMTHDGSNMTSLEHFAWPDGQEVTYLKGSNLHLFLGENDNYNYTCMRAYADVMRMTYCHWRRHLFCQGKVSSTPFSPSTPAFYMKRDNVTSQDPQQQTLTYFDAFQDPARLPVPLNMRNMGVDEMDTADCFLLCARLQACSVVAVLRDDTACFVQV